MSRRVQGPQQLIGRPCAPGRSAGRVWLWPADTESTGAAGASPGSDSTVSDSTVSDPAVSDPAGSDPAVSDPAVSDPAGSDPAGSDPLSASNRLSVAIASVQVELAAQRDRLAACDEDELTFIDVQRWLLADPLLTGRAYSQTAHGVSAEDAVVVALGAASTQLLATEDPTLRARIPDIEQLGRRILAALRGPQGESSAPLGAVVVAADLSADTLLELLGPAVSRAARPVRGVLLERGGPLTHCAILARQRGIPLIAGLGDLRASCRTGDGVLVDGDTGQVLLRPDRSSARTFTRRNTAAADTAAGQSTPPALPPALPPHNRAAVHQHAHVRILANLDLPEDSQRARAQHAAGIGLLRTDGLIGASGPPSVKEQARRYSTLLADWPGTTVVIRLFDAPDLAPGHCGPLGPRGIRWLDLKPERSNAQLLALCMAAVTVPDTRLIILAPMVSHAQQLDVLRRRIAQQWSRLPHPASQPPPGLGAMIETPAAALTVPALAERADLLAVGSNDLLMLLVGASRTDPRVADLLDLRHPALWTLLRQISADCQRHRVPVIICGLLSSDPVHAAALVGLGFGQLSVGVEDLARVRAGLRGRGVDSAAQGS